MLSFLKLREGNEMDLALIIAMVGTGLAMVGVVISMMFWIKSESNHLHTEANSQATALRNDANEDRKEMVRIISAIELEMKDFHYKLLEIERGR
jgi:hypothetical protein